MVILLATLVALYGLFLLIVSLNAPWGLLTLLPAVMLIGGLLMRKPVIAWLGLGLLVLFVFSALFLFSIGADLLQGTPAVAGILLILLSIVPILRRSRRP